MSSSPKDILPLTHRPFGDENQHYVDHPEPELLATSVGKEVDGRLIPSSSTISLLSLNQSPSLRNSTTTSYTNLQHLQRMQPYHNQKVTTSPADYTHSFSTSRFIPIQQQPPPDSPNLAPISLGSSPSRFWLSSPPKSMNRIGDEPVIRPVQTPLEEPPMTPLYLNRPNVTRSDYFSRVSTVSEEEERRSMGHK